MSDTDSNCTLLPAALVAAYADGSLGDAQSWSVEAHLPGCACCRAVLADRRAVDTECLDRNRTVLLARLGLPAPSPLRRALRRCGLSDEIVTLLTATPSLRRSWLTGILLVLAVALGVAWAGRVASVPVPPARDQVTWNLVPFLVLAPLLSLGAVAAAFSSVLDPAYQLAVAAPMSKARLLLVRAVAVIGATLVPTVAFGLALPGPWWLPAATLLPTLALCSAALAAGMIGTPTRAAFGAGACWLAAVVAAGLVAHSPALIFGLGGQLTALVVLAVACAALVARRRHIDPALMR
jgi:hypothetical protein